MFNIFEKEVTFSCNFWSEIKASIKKSHKTITLTNISWTLHNLYLAFFLEYLIHFSSVSKILILELLTHIEFLIR